MQEKLAKHFRVSFSGKSMYPLLKPRDNLYVKLYSENRNLIDFELGDILVHKDSSEWMAHRLVNHKGLQLKADWNKHYWNPKIVGKVVGLERGKVIIYWGENGHPLKWVMTFFTKFTGSRLKLMRLTSKLALLFLAEFSFIFCKYSCKSREFF